MTTDGIAFPPAGSIHGIDYSFARPDPKMLAARGIRLAGRYIWNDKYQDGRTNKGINRAEYDALKAEGIDPFFFYETSAEDYIKGFDTGVRHATDAGSLVNRFGLPELPIHFNVDHDTPASEIPAILDGLSGANSIVGVARTWLYGKYDVVKAAFDAGVIGGACQTYAWSNGKWDSRANTQQWSNGQWGDSVDFTRAMKPEFGQNPVAS